MCGPALHDEAWLPLAPLRLAGHQAAHVLARNALPAEVDGHEPIALAVVVKEPAGPDFMWAVGFQL